MYYSGGSPGPVDATLYSGNCRHVRSALRRDAVQLHYSLILHHIGGRVFEYKEACQTCSETAGIRART